MTQASRVVFDCNVLFQALIAPRGPGGAVIALAMQQRVILFMSDYIFAELRDTATRPHLAARFGITERRLADFLDSLQQCATVLETVPHVFDFPRDPDDAHYVDLAIAANAQLIVSRDADLLSLGDDSTPEGRDFAVRFPSLQILTPPQLLKKIAATPDE